MAVIGFSQSVYTAVEGGDTISVCINLVSLTGQFTEGPLIGVTIRGPSMYDLSVSGIVNLTGVEVGEAILCGTDMIEDDDILEGPRLFAVSASVDRPETITFSPGGDHAIVFVIDNDGTHN